MTARDETGWEFDPVQRVYANSGLTEDGRQTVVAWEIVRPSPRSTALAPEEVRRETLTLPIRRREARVFTVRARMFYRFAPTSEAFAPEESLAVMAEASTTLPGGRPSRRSR